MAYIVNFLYHLRAVRDALPPGVEASVDVETCRLCISAPSGKIYLIPQFVGRREGRLVYSPELLSSSRGFIGWLPYFNRRWPAAVDKIAFKKACEELEVLAPRHWLSRADVSSTFLVKKSRSSFGAGISGPYLVEDAGHLDDDTDVYYDEFKVGKMVKVWYWGERPICMESVDMPALIGDGRKTLSRLLDKGKIGTNLEGNRDIYKCMFSWQGFGLEYIPSAGERVLADFRIGSPLLPQLLDDTNVWEKYEETAVGAGFVRLGQSFVKMLPNDFRGNTMYTVDAIVTEDDRIWSLEMNCNPMLHPAVYKKMIPAVLDDTLRRSKRSPPMWRFV